MQSTQDTAVIQFRPPQFVRAVRHGLLLALVWWVLSEGEAQSWWIGAPAIAAGVWASLVLTPPSRYRLRFSGLIRFIPFFLWRSVAGGVDVAWRALHPAVRIDPSLERYELRLPAAGPGRTFFVGVVSLLPGTLSADLHGNELVVHVLRGGTRALTLLAILEERVADIFGQPLRVRSTQPDNTQ